MVNDLTNEFCNICFCFNRHFVPILGMVSSYSVITTPSLVMCPVYVCKTSIFSPIVNSPAEDSGRFVSVYTDTSALHEDLCTLIQNRHKYCKLPQIDVFSNYV